MLSFYDCAAYFIKLDNLRVSASYRDVNSFNKQRRQRILHASPSSGSANGWTTLINMDWVSITLSLHIHPSALEHLVQNKTPKQRKHNCDIGSFMKLSDTNSVILNSKENL